MQLAELSSWPEAQPVSFDKHVSGQRRREKNKSVHANFLLVTNPISLT